MAEPTRTSWSRVAVCAGAPPAKIKSGQNENLLKVLTVALTMTMNQVASPLRLCKHQINLLATLSPLTLSSSINIFFAYRILQTRTMFLYVLHSPNFHSKLGALLQGATCTRHLYGTTTASHQQLVLQVLLWTLCCVCQIFLYPKTPTSSLHWFYLWTYYGKRTFPLSKIQTRP